MSVALRGCATALRPRNARLILTLIAVGLPALWAQGCASPVAAPYTQGDPSDPNARTPPVRYRSTVGPYRSERPVEPSSWGEQNQRVAPTPRQ
jgi:hypothetical protein